MPTSKRERNSFVHPRGIFSRRSSANPPPLDLETRRQGAEAAPLRMAIVDDHAIMRCVFKTIAEDTPGLEVAWEASSAAEFRSRLDGEMPDCLILDVNLPDGNGYDLAKEALQKDPNVAVLIVSVQTGMQPALRAYEAGARGFVSKQASPAVILEALSKLSTKEYYFRTMPLGAATKAPVRVWFCKV